MRVRELMTPESKVVTVDPETTVDRAVDLLLRHEIGALPVVDRSRAPVGLVAERDIVRGLYRHGVRILDLTVERVMRRPPPVCDADDPVGTIMERMTRERMRHLIVRDGGRLAGVVSVGDLVKSRLRELEVETGVLRDYVSAQRSRF